VDIGHDSVRVRRAECLTDEVRSGPQPSPME
jgi:hypothetical protein